jgi:hypothetical protein
MQSNKISRRKFVGNSALAIAGLTVMPTILSGQISERKRFLSEMKYCLQPAYKLPVIRDVDVVVSGGSVAGVAAATAFAKQGLSVFLAAGLTYLGDDICATYRYQLEDGEEPLSVLAKKIFTSSNPTPIHVKVTLEDELIDNGVDFLYSTYVTEILTDKQGQLGGIVISNRSGRQVIRTKAIVDVTNRASVARLCGASFSTYPAGYQKFQFIVVGNEPTSENGMTVRRLPHQVRTNGLIFDVLEYTLTIRMDDDRLASFANALQTARDLTWHYNQVDSSEILFQIPPDSLLSQGGTSTSDISDIPISATRPRGMDRIYVLGGCADISREQMGKILRPVNMLAWGESFGNAVAAEIKAIKKIEKITLQNAGRKENVAGIVTEYDQEIRPAYLKEKMIIDKQILPVIGEYDVVVMGGGTAGAGAGIGAARNGAKTLVLDYYNSLGGLATVGLIGVYFHGYRCGFTTEMDTAVPLMAPRDHWRQKHNNARWNVDWKMEWLRREFRKAGGEFWNGVIGCGAFVEGKTVKGVVIATPQGRGVLLAKTVIDSTGSGDIAIAAGSGFEYTGRTTVAVQGCGLGFFRPGDSYNNNDWTFIDDSDVFDISRAFIGAKNKFRGNYYDVSKMPQTRERRRIIGEYAVSVTDIMNSRRYSDTISIHKSSFDTHGYTIDKFFTLKQPTSHTVIHTADVPLRSLLPKGFDGIIVTGLGASAHRDAMPVIRMQACLQNQGYSVGYLVAIAAKEGKSVRQIDIRQIQRYLVEIENLPERVLSDNDDEQFTEEEFREAVRSVTNGFDGLEILMADTQRAIPLLRQQYEASTGDNRVVYAQILAMLGIADGWKDLVTKIDSYTVWDEGWKYTGGGQFGSNMSPLDSLIIALGHTKKKEAVNSVIAKMALLTPDQKFSHFRSISMACEQIDDEKATKPLYDALNMEGIRGHEVTDYKTARTAIVSFKDDVTFRNKALKELHLARALYRCGDYNGLGETILTAYANDLHGHYSRHAMQILNENIQNKH